ncbi:hypothetical protein GYM54_01300 [Pseudomonas sp. MTM4]|uniref:hypothetical protein n=1 Tax=unclassified Pseudomonas TaxID=196821 RepID=UPI0018D24896|nr:MULTISPECIES: hypothetical protein [unclassified Pseudomonas]MBC8648374.1 hypothetical protein [Pseudomonas sp. MT4]QXY90319.1 hypothetical protein GYM54_01300 [Pseudomonas sp. MTM4]
MSSLAGTCKKLLSDLQTVKVANQTKQEISALQQRLREWTKHANARRALVEKVRIVEPSLLAREDIVQADCAVKGLAQQAKTLLLAGGNLQDLAVDNLWTRLIAAAESANDKVRSAARDQWRQFVESLGRVDTPTYLDEQMLRTPANEDLLRTYKEHYPKYSAIARTDLPASTSTPDELIRVVSTLQDVQQQLKGTAPEAVRLFLKAVESGGASMDLITPEVMQWLQANDEPSRFVVKSRTNVLWR